MPISPETRYCLDGWNEAGTIAADVHRYFVGHCRNPDDIVLPALNGGAGVSVLENMYLDWRQENPELSSALSLFVVDDLRRSIRKAVDEFVIGVTSCTPDMEPRRLSQLRGRDGCGILGFSPTLTHRIRILRRALGRAAHDLAGLDERAIADLRDRERVAQQAVYQREIAPLMAMLDDMANAVACMPVYTDEDFRKLSKPMSPRERRARVRRSRAIFKRSLAFLGKLIAPEAVRRFISHSEPLRIPGQHCNYEITRRKLQIDYGDANLALLDRDGGLICKVCLHTRDVPTLDHVAGIILCVLSGREEEILKPGNFYDMPQGRELPDWLAPYHPSASDRGGHMAAIQMMIDDALGAPIVDPFLFEPVTWELTQKLRKRTYAKIYAEIADLVAVLPIPPVVPRARIEAATGMVVDNHTMPALAA
jgi:hypothetical protein